MKDKLIEDRDLLIVPSVYLYEVFKVIRRERDEDAAFVAVAAMQEGQVVDLDTSLAVEAAAVRLEQDLALADSVIYATALRHDALLWTQDALFQGKPGVRYLAKQ